MPTVSRVLGAVLLVVALLVTAPPATPQAKPSVRIGYIPTDSFAAMDSLLLAEVSRAAFLWIVATTQNETTF